MCSLRQHACSLGPASAIVLLCVHGAQALGVHKDVSTSNTLIAGFAVLGDLRAAEAALQELEAASAFSSAQGLARPQETQGRPTGATTRTLTTLLKAFVEADRWDRALLVCARRPRCCFGRKDCSSCSVLPPRACSCTCSPHVAAVCAVNLLFVLTSQAVASCTWLAGPLTHGCAAV